MKRDLIDLIDQIHSDEFSGFSEEVNRITEKMKVWLRNEYEPVNFDVEIAKIIHKLDDELREQQAFKERIEQCNTYQMIRARIQKISDICKKYNIQDVTKTSYILKDRILFDQFVHDVDQPFLDYKRDSNIDRMLIK